MAVCITDSGALSRVSLIDQPALLQDLVHATYGDLVALFGPEDREPAEAPGWTVLTADGVAYLRYSGERRPGTSPRIRTGDVVTWAIWGSTYAVAAWIHKVLGRPAGIAVILA